MLTSSKIGELNSQDCDTCTKMCYADMFLSKTAWREVEIKPRSLQTLRYLTSIFLRGWLFCCETGMLSLDPKGLSSKLIIRSTGLKT